MALVQGVALVPMTLGPPSMVGSWGAGGLHQRLHAFVKKALLQQLVPSDALVCDIYCGRGTETANWAQAEIGRYIGVDLSASALGEAREQWKSKADLETQLKNEGLPADVVCCLAHLQDCFTSEDMVRRLLKNVAALLKPGGFFFGTAPDSSTIWYKYQKAVEGAMKAGSLRVNGTLPRVRTDLYTISFEDDRFHCYGSKYQLRFVDDSLPAQAQLLVHFPSLIRLAAEMKLEYVEIQNLTDFYEDYRIPFADTLQSSCGTLFDSKGIPLVDGRGRLSPVAQDVLSLYTTFIFKKADPSAQQENHLQVPAHHVSDAGMVETVLVKKESSIHYVEHDVSEPKESPQKKQRITTADIPNAEDPGLHSDFGSNLPSTDPRPTLEDTLLLQDVKSKSPRWRDRNNDQFPGRATDGGGCSDNHEKTNITPAQSFKEGEDRGDLNENTDQHGWDGHSQQGSQSQDLMKKKRSSRSARTFAAPSVQNVDSHLPEGVGVSSHCEAPALQRDEGPAPQRSRHTRAAAAAAQVAKSDVDSHTVHGLRPRGKGSSGPHRQRGDTAKQAPGAASAASETSQEIAMQGGVRLWPCRVSKKESEEQAGTPLGPYNSHLDPSSMSTAQQGTGRTKRSARCRSVEEVKGQGGRQGSSNDGGGLLESSSKGRHTADTRVTRTRSMRGTQKDKVSGVPKVTKVEPELEEPLAPHASTQSREEGLGEPRKDKGVTCLQAQQNEREWGW